MATVYFARDPSFGRYVAIKTLPSAWVHDADSRERFEREGRMIASLEHPAIVPVYDFGEDSGHPYLVMQFMKGGSLAHRLRRKIFSLEEACDLITVIASAIDKIHKEGVVHRDLKPDNILFDEDDNPYIADFGIANLSNANAGVGSMAMLGTLNYASPERLLRGNTSNFLSDIYALGVILFEMVTGEIPYPGEMTIQVIKAILSAPVPKASKINPDLPVALDSLLERALAKNPAHRYQSAAELAHTLRFLLESPGSIARQHIEAESFSPQFRLLHTKAKPLFPLRSGQFFSNHPNTKPEKRPTKHYRPFQMGAWLVMIGALAVAISANAGYSIPSFSQKTRTPTLQTFYTAVVTGELFGRNPVVESLTPTPFALFIPEMTNPPTKDLVYNETEKGSASSTDLPIQTQIPKNTGIEQTPSRTPTVPLTNTMTPIPTSTSPRPLLTETPTPRPTKDERDRPTITPTPVPPTPTIAPP